MNQASVVPAAARNARWKGYTPRQLRALYRAETPEDFVTRFPPSERQPLPGQQGHQPISKDVLARKAARHLAPIVQPPWSAEFRRLMSDDKALERLQEFFPVRWALLRLGERTVRKIRWRESHTGKSFLVSCMTLYLISNYDEARISEESGAKMALVKQALRSAAGIMSDLIGTLGHDLLILDPTRFAEGITPEAVA